MKKKYLFIPLLLFWASSSFAQEAQLLNIEAPEDIVVIQKKFYPKSGRFEFFFGGYAQVNNRLLTSFGGRAHLAYHFSERWALEFVGLYQGELNKDITTNLKNQYGVDTVGFVTQRNYFGLEIQWSPIYGKLSLFERSINPYELSFSLGGGIVQTSDAQSVGAGSWGIGQLHPLNDSLALRWRVGGNMFVANGKQNLNGVQANKSLFNYTINVSLGVSFLFPGLSE